MTMGTFLISPESHALLCPVLNTPFTMRLFLGSLVWPIQIFTLGPIYIFDIHISPSIANNRYEYWTVECSYRKAKVNCEVPLKRHWPNSIPFRLLIKYFFFTIHFIFDIYVSFTQEYFLYAVGGKAKSGYQFVLVNSGVKPEYKTLACRILDKYLEIWRVPSAKSQTAQRWPSTWRQYWAITEMISKGCTWRPRLGHLCCQYTGKLWPTE